jgi:SnoaL-like domain
MEKRTGIDAVHNFWGQVWQSPQNFDAIDALVVEDFVFITGGRRIEGRKAFKKWAGDFSAAIGNLESEIVDSFENRDGSRVASTFGSRVQTTEPSAQSLTAAPSS